MNVQLLASFGGMSLLLGINTWLAAHSTQGATRGLILVLGLAGLALGGLFGWRLGRGVVDPIQRATAVARRIIAGDLTGTEAVERDDEIGQLQHALSQLNERFFRVVSDVRVNCTIMAATSSQVSRDNASLSDRTASQASSLQATSASMSRLTSTVAENADSAEQANNFVSAAAQIALKGGVVVSQVVSTMGSIKDSSRRIADIIGVIDSIAFQTNILALNAAVEAARAGDQGKGFAVVANEVGTLAKRSAAAAREIKSLITDSVAKVDSGSKLVDDAGRAMSEIVASVTRVAEIVGRISNESREQSASVQSVNASISQIDGMINLNAGLVRDAAKVTGALNEYSVALLKSVSQFDLGTREFGDADDAVAMVERAVGFCKEYGREALIADINSLSKGQFLDRDLYLMAINLADAKFVAHGNNSRVLGHGGTGSKDVDGKSFVVEMAMLARTAGSGWVEYKWAHPITNEIKVKNSYLERVGDLAVICGIYKQ
jgi:methyl-accepting chemotaxis protein